MPTAIAVVRRRIRVARGFTRKLPCCFAVTASALKVTFVSVYTSICKHSVLNTVTQQVNIYEGYKLLIAGHSMDASRCAQLCEMPAFWWVLSLSFAVSEISANA